MKIFVAANNLVLKANTHSTQTPLALMIESLHLPYSAGWELPPPPESVLDTNRLNLPKLQRKKILILSRTSGNCCSVLSKLRSTNEDY